MASAILTGLSLLALVHGKGDISTGRIAWVAVAFDLASIAALISYVLR